jgi:hypothetical protein
VNWAPLTSLSARSRTYRPDLGTNRISCSAVVLGSVPAATGAPQAVPLGETYTSYRAIRPFALASCRGR